jgi:hypothetical protein
LWQGRWGLSRTGLSPLRICFSDFPESPDKIHPVISGKAVVPFLLFTLSSFACPKEETRKGHPSQSWPCGLPLLLDEGGTRKNSGFALRQFPRLFRPRLRGAAGQMGEGKIPLARSRAPERLPKKGFALFEAKPSLQSPGSIEERRASRPRRDKT